MPPLKPYTLREAADAIGMSRDWLRARMAESRELREAAFRTRGKSGHYRFDRDAFHAWWEGHQAKGAVAKPTRQRRQRRARQARVPSHLTGAAFFKAAMEAA